MWAGEFRSGQVDAGKGFTYWLLKFDGISNNRDKELADPQGFGQIEYAFYLLATAAGINMSRSRLHREGGRAHFMTQRFDRDESGRKLHMQSLAALRHFDFNAAGAFSYEQAIETARMMKLPAADIVEQFSRAILNILIRNQDDHVKNIAFLMNRDGEWRLSPAFDVVYAYNPTGDWTSRHQMSLNHKRDHFEYSDLVEFGRFCGLKPKHAHEVIQRLREHVENWMTYAGEARVPESQAVQIFRTMRRELAKAA